jgi:divinyl chlorophyllide a 8-vinyl-reductase
MPSPVNRTPVLPPAAGTTQPQRVLLLGATGTIGRATAAALLQAGHHVVCVVRPGARAPAAALPELAGAALREADVCQPGGLARSMAGERFEVWVSCLASRTGAPADAWAIDHQAHVHALAAAQAAGVQHVVLLSAMCVQKPLLAFQQAKLAFEAALVASGLRYSIVRPTAFFKSLCGQVGRVKAGKPFLLFGDGALTACKPISDRDLAHYIARCITDPSLHNRVLPIGGPGPAITPRQQGEKLFELLGQPARFKQVPVGLMGAVVAVLATLSRVLPPLAKKAELARIGRYYATESMLVLNPQTGQYDASATPSTGSDTLFELYAQLVAGASAPERGEHAVF